MTSRLAGRGRGGVRGYLATAWRVSRRPGAVLGDELERMVEPRAARRFRWTTVGVAWVSAALVLYWQRWLWYVASRSSGGGFQVRTDLDGLLLWAWSYWVSVGALLVFLAWGTGVAGWVAYSRRLDDVRANRAAGLARYTCAPLAWTPLVALASSGVAEVMRKYQDLAAFAVWEWWVFVGTPPALMVLAWAWCVASLGRGTRGWGVLRAIGMAVGVVAAWGVMGAVVFGLAHGVSALGVLVWRSWG